MSLIIIFLLFQLDSVRRVCSLMGLRPKGSKLDIIQLIIKASLGRLKFEEAYSKIHGHSGGWLSAVCPHNVVYGVKFLLRSESPRDYTDLMRSFKHVPTVNIIDIAHSVAKVSNDILPGMFPDNEGRLAAATPENIRAAQEETLRVSIPALTDNQPVANVGDTEHPITGLSERFLLFDWFHEKNSTIAKEALRRSSFVKEIAGLVNTQAAEQLHRDRKKDIYWLSSMTPSNHIFLFKLICHLQNMYTNKAEIARQQKKMGGIQLGFNDFGQLSIPGMPQSSTTAKERKIIVTFVQPTSSPGLSSSPSSTQHEQMSNETADTESAQNSSSSQPTAAKRPREPPCDSTSAGKKPKRHAPFPTTKKQTPQAGQSKATSRSGDFLVYKGQHLSRRRVYGDGNCLFRAVSVLATDNAEDDFQVLRLRAYEWALLNRHLINYATEKEIQAIGENGQYGENAAVQALSNSLNLEIIVLFHIPKFGLDRQVFRPVYGKLPKRIHLFLDMSTSHYDSLLPVETIRTLPKRLPGNGKNKWPCLICGKPTYKGGCVGCSKRDADGVYCPVWACFKCVGLTGKERWLDDKRWFCSPEHVFEK
jgi:hypothetical protein